MAKPTIEEIKKARKNIEAELMGGVTSIQTGYDIQGIPKLTMPKPYIAVEGLPPGVSLASVTGESVAQTKLQQLVDLQLQLEQEQYKTIGMPMDPETSDKRRKEIYDQYYEDYIVSPLKAEYGTLEEKKKGPQLAGKLFGVAPAPSMSEPAQEDPSLITAMRPQARSIEPAEIDIDWDVITENYAKEEGLKPEDAEEQIRAFKEQYDLYRNTFPEATPEEAFTGLADFVQGVQDAPAIEKPESIEQQFSEAEGGAIAKAFGKQIEAKGEMPPDYTPDQMLFVKQQMQSDYNKIYNKTLSSAKSGEEVDGIRITIDQGTGTAVDIPLATYQAIMSSNPKLPTYKPVYDAKTDEKIRNGMPGKQLSTKLTQGGLPGYARGVALGAIGNPDAWYLDPETKKMVLDSPEDFVQEGWMSNVSPFGDVQEGTAAYSLRMLMSPLNAIAGTIQAPVEYATAIPMGVVAEGLELVGAIPRLEEGESYFDPGALSRQRQKQREKETPLYADSPILANIALNKGFTGEAQDISNALNLTGATKYATIGGGFLMDIASPDVGLIAAAGKAAKVGAPIIGDAARINKAMYGTSGKVIDNALEGLKAGKATFMDDLNGVSAILKEDTFLTKGAKKVADSKVGEIVAKVPGTKKSAELLRSGYKVANIPYASVTAKVAETNAEILKAQRGIQAGMDPLEAITDLPKNHPYRAYVTKMVNNGEEVKPFGDLMGDPNNAKILKEWEETQNAIRELDQLKEVRGPKGELSIETRTIDDIIDGTGIPREFFDSVAIARTGKRFKDLDQIGMSAEELARVVDQKYARALTLNVLGPKDLADMNKIFALTRNSWAHQDDIGKIIAGANDTPLGKVLAKIRNTQKVASQMPTTGGIPFMGRKGAPDLAQSAGQVRKFGSRSIVEKPEIVPSFKIDDATLKELKEVLPAQMDDLKQTILADGKIDFNEFNLLVNRNIDNYVTSTAKGYTGKELSLLSDRAQHIILEQGTDGLLTRGARLLISKMKKEATDIDNPLPMTTIQQKQLMKNVRSRASTMDTQLRRDLDLLMANDDDMVRELYSITQPKGTKLSSEEALGYAIMGKKQQGTLGVVWSKLDQEKTAKEISGWLVERLFYTKKQPIGLFSKVDGSNQLAYRQLLNESGQKQFDEIIDRMLFEVKGDSSKLMDQIFGQGGLVDQYEMLIKQKKYLNVSVDPTKIVKTPKAQEQMNKLAIGMYYKSEAERIIAGEIATAIRENVLKTDLKSIVGDQLYIDYASLMGRNLTTPELIGHTNKMIENLCTRNMNNPHSTIWDYIQSEAITAGILTDAQKVGTPEAFADLVAKLPSRQKQQIDVLARTVRKAEETAEMILKNNGLSHNKFDSDMDKVQELFNLLGTKGNDANARFAEAVLGRETYSEFQKLISENKLNILTDQIDASLKDTTLLKSVLEASKNFFTGVNRFFYPLILSARPSFHGGNIFSAPFIVYQSTGSLSALRPSMVNKGRRLAFSALTPQDRYFYEIATIDKSGRVWTYGELNKLMNEAGIESRLQASSSMFGTGDLEAYIRRKAKNKFSADTLWGLTKDTLNIMKDTAQAPLDVASRLTIKEDLLFRSSVLLEALEDGKSIDEALLMARESLFDYKGMSDWERANVAKYLVFYSFVRANLGHFVKSIGSAETFKTYWNILKLKRGTDIAMAQALGGDYIDDRFFFEDRFTSKIFLGFTTTPSGSKIGITTPGIPALDASVQFFEMFYDPIEFVGDQAIGMLRPSLKKTLDVKGKFDYQYRTVPSKYIDVNRFSEDSPQEVASFFESIVGGEIFPRQGTPEEGAINGYIYPLSQEQAKKFKQYESIFDTTGALVMYQDYYNIFSGAGTIREDIPGLLIPFTKQSKIADKETLELRNVRARKYAIQDKIKQLSRELATQNQPE